VAKGAENAYVVAPVAGSTADFTLVSWIHISTEWCLGLCFPIGADAQSYVSMRYANDDFWTTGVARSYDPNVVPSLLGKWCHVAKRVRGAVFDLILNGRALCVGLPHEKTASSWDGTQANNGGPGVGGPGDWCRTDLGWAHMAAYSGQLTDDQIGAHMTATAPLPTSLPHVVCLGSSMQVTVDTGDPLQEATRVAAGVSSTLWHNFATHGRGVTSPTANDMSLNLQVMLANNTWNCRGGVAIVDYGNVHNTAGSADYNAVVAADLLFRTQVTHLLRSGWRVIMIDWAESTTWGGLSGGLLRQVQEDFYAHFGASVIRFRTREVLEDWTNDAYYTDDGGSHIHFSSVGVAKMAPALAALVGSLRSQPIPAATPAWV
jgi:hypothetical protein